MSRIEFARCGNLDWMNDALNPYTVSKPAIRQKILTLNNRRPVAISEIAGSAYPRPRWRITSRPWSRLPLWRKKGTDTDRPSLSSRRKIWRRWNRSSASSLS